MKSTNEKSATPDNDYNHSEPINIHLTVYWIYVITCTIMIVSLCSYVGRLSPNTPPVEYLRLAVVCRSRLGNGVDGYATG